MSPEFYLEWIDNTKITRPYQMIILILLFYKQARDLENLLIEQGHKMNEHALWAIRTEIGRLHFDIMTCKANIEN